MGCAPSTANGAGVAPNAQQQPAPAPVQQAPPAAAVAPAHEHHAAAPAKEAPHAAAKEQPVQQAPEVDVHAAKPAPAAKPAAPPKTKITVPAPKKGAPLKVDWSAIKAKLPFEQTPEQQEKRKKLFEQFDVSATGLLSLAKIDKGVRDVLGLDEIFDAKPVIMRAYEEARAMSKADTHKGIDEDDFVTQAEFRLLLSHLFHFFVLWELFEGLDLDGEGRLSIDEFRAAVPTLQSMGVKIDNVEATFAIAAGGAGDNFIVFSEFCEWALKNHLEQTAAQ